MTRNDDQRLDEMLQRWAARHEARDDDLSVLTSRVVRMAQSDAVRPAQLPPGRRFGRRRAARRTIWTLGGVLAASLAALIAATSWRGGRPSQEIGADGSGIRDVAASLAQISPSDLAEMQLVAGELQREFPRHFSWFVESDGAVDLGLNDDGDDSISRQIIAIRLVVETRGPSDEQWERLRTIDIVVRAEDVVQAAPAEGEGRMTLWAYAVPDGMIAVDVDLNLAGPAPVRVLASRLMTAGAPLEIWRGKRDGVLFRVSQAAEIVAEDGLG